LSQEEEMQFVLRLAENRRQSWDRSVYFILCFVSFNRSRFKIEKLFTNLIYLFI